MCQIFVLSACKLFLPTLIFHCNCLISLLDKHFLTSRNCYFDVFLCCKLHSIIFFLNTIIFRKYSFLLTFIQIFTDLYSKYHKENKVVLIGSVYLLSKINTNRSSFIHSFTYCSCSSNFVDYFVRFSVRFLIKDE